jgi:hypothetical protein
VILVAALAVLGADAPQGAGDVVVDDAQVRRCMAARDAVVSRQGAVERFADKILVGPALWEALQLGSLGVELVVTLQTRRGAQELHGRYFDGDERQKLLSAKALQQVFAKVSGGRAANATERATYYELVPFEISGKPVTVLGEGDARLICDTEGTRVLWIDLIGGYLRRAEGRPWQ